jgi:hypothetical protein
MNSNPQQQQQLSGTEANVIPAEKPDEQSELVNAIFDDLEKKQPDTLDNASKGLIERITTFLGVLFGVTVLSKDFPPTYLKGNTTAKVIIVLSLICFLCSIGTAILGMQVHRYRRYTNNITKTDEELKRMLMRKLVLLRVANILFALGAIALAALLIVIVWSV